MKFNTEKQAIVWGGLLIIFGLLSLIEVYFRLFAWVWIVVLAAAGFGVFWIYTTDRSDRWLLIPAYVLWAVAGLIAITTINFLDNIIATYVLGAIALPFLYVYWRDRAQWWALIPAYSLAAVGFMVFLIEANVIDDILVAAYVMFAIAIPFFVVYFRNKGNWWALIPGGIMAVLGISFLLSGDAAQFVGPLVLVIAGGWIIFRQFSRKETAKLETKKPVSSEDDTGSAE
ncbi:MAG: hypothetical protein MUO76_07475 [Anaerolineaceae bacterium]|nr:hypothetical protein [Anaerolineaceae bacterium]